MGDRSGTGPLGRHLLALLQATSLAAGLLVMPSPPAALAQDAFLPSPPVMYITPDCFTTGGSQTLTIHGRNFEPKVRVQVSLYNYLAVSSVTDTSAYGTFTTTLTVDVDDYYLSVHLEARIVAGEDVPPPVADAYAHGCGSDALVVATPNCGGPDGPSINVHGERFASYADIVVELTLGGSPIGKSVTVPATSAFDVTLEPGVSLDRGEYTVRATEGKDGGEVYAFGYDTFIVPCPEVTIDPQCVQSPGSPPDRLDIAITGIGGWLPDTADGSDEIEIVFDPDGEPQEFFWSAPYGVAGIGEDGRFDRLTINPYARPRGNYTIQIKQQGYKTDPIVDLLVTFTVPCHVYSPVLTVDQKCGPPQIVGDIPRSYALTLTATDFPLGKFVAIFDPEGAAAVQPTRLEFLIDQVGEFEVPFDVPYRQPGHYRIELVSETSEGLYSASASFDVPCAPAAPTLELEPPCVDEAAGQPGAYEIAVTGGGFVPGPVELVFDPTGTPESGPPASAEDDGSLKATFIANGRPPNTYAMLARQTTALGVFDEASATLTVGCEGPVLTITPTLGPRGFVPMLEGFGFTAGVVLQLTWDFGIGADRPMDVKTDVDGHFTKQLLIFHHDFIGPRHLSVEQPDDPLALNDLGVDYLVTSGTVSPPFVTDNPIAAEPIFQSR